MNSTLIKKITVANNKEFLNTLKVFKVNIDKSQTISKQTYFSIDYINKKLTIKNFDYYNYLINTFSIDTDLVLPSQDFLVDTEQLLDAVKSCKKMDVLEITLKDTSLNIGGFNLFFKDFEELQQSEVEVFNRSTIATETSQNNVKNLLEFNIDTNVFIKNIKNSLNFASNDEAREHLNGVAIKFKENGLGFYATDSFFLIKINNFHNLNTCKEDFFILPTKLCKNLVASADILKDNIKIVVDNNSIVKMFCENLTIEGRLIRQNFPDADKIIPRGEAFKINLKTDVFLNAVKISNKVADSGLLYLNLNNNTLLLTKKKGSNISFQLPINFNSDNKVNDYNNCFKSEPLLKCIKTYKNFTNQDNIFISFQDGHRPLKIECLDDNKQAITILLMPTKP